MNSEIDLIYREWQEAIRDRFNIKGEQVVVAKPSNSAHLSILKEMCLKAGFTSDQANSIVLILEKFQAKSAESGKVVDFSSAEARDDAIKKGTHKELESGDEEGEEGEEKEKETNPNFDQTNIDGGHLTNKGSKEKEEKEKPFEIINGDLDEGDNKVKNDMFKYGYGGYKKATGSKPAPGGAGSAFNEIVSGEGVHVLEENPNMTEEELTRVLYDRTKNTKLGEEQKKTTGTGKIPKDVENKNLWTKCVIAARSAKKKHERTQKRIKRLQDQDKFGEPKKISTFYGAQSSIDAQVEMVKNAKTVLLPNGQVVKKEDAIAFIKAGGGGMNPSDTATFVQDDEGNLLIQFHSDKTTTADIQDNSTIIQEGENYKSYIDEDNSLSESEKEDAKKTVDEYSEKIKAIEENYNSQAVPIAQRLTELPIEDQVKAVEEDKGTLEKNLNVAIFGENFPEGGESVGKKYEQYLPPGVDPKDLTTAQKLEMLRKCVADGNGVTNDTKTINKLGLSIARNDPSIEGLDVKKNLSDQRERVVNLQRERINKLNEIKSGLGTSMEANEAERAFHLKMMDYPPKEYEEGNPESLMGAALDVNMGGNIVNGEVLRDCLGVKNTDEFKEKFRLVEEEKITTDEAGNVTGKVVFVYALGDDDKRIDIGFKTYRSKAGAAGKTNNTMAYSTDMQNCFKTGEKP